MGALKQLRAWIDVHALGFHFVTVYLRFAPTKKAVKNEFISFVSKRPTSTLVFETTGDFHLAVSFAVPEIPEVFSFFEILEKYSKIIITTKVLCIQRDFEFFGRRYLRSTKCKISPIELPSSKMPSAKVDEIDRVILATLSQRDWSTERDLFTRIRVPYTTINRRLLSLRQRKILRGYSYWLDPQHFARQSVILRIKVSGIAAWVKEKIWKFARAHRSVVYIIECIGSWEYEIGADIESAAEMLRLVDEVLSLLEGVEVSVEPVMVTSFYKTQSFPGSLPPPV